MPPDPPSLASAAPRPRSSGASRLQFGRFAASGYTIKPLIIFGKRKKNKNENNSKSKNKVAEIRGVFEGG